MKFETKRGCCIRVAEGCCRDSRQTRQRWAICGSWREAAGSCGAVHRHNNSERKPSKRWESEKKTKTRLSGQKEGLKVLVYLLNSHHQENLRCLSLSVFLRASALCVYIRSHAQIQVKSHSSERSTISLLGY